MRAFCFIGPDKFFVSEKRRPDRSLAEVSQRTWSALCAGHQGDTSMVCRVLSTPTS